MSILLISFALHFAHKMHIFCVQKIPRSCSLFCIVLFFQWHILRALLILHILVNRSNICTLLHRFVHYKNDPFCCSLFFYARCQLPACFWLLHYSQCYSLLSHSNQQSHEFTVNCRRPLPLERLPPRTSNVVGSRIQKKPFIHWNNRWLLTWHLGLATTRRPLRKLAPAPSTASCSRGPIWL